MIFLLKSRMDASIDWFDSLTYFWSVDWLIDQCFSGKCSFLMRWLLDWFEIPGIFPLALTWIQSVISRGLGLIAQSAEHGGSRGLAGPWRRCTLSAAWSLVGSESLMDRRRDCHVIGDQRGFRTALYTRNRKKKDQTPWEFVQNGRRG